MNYANQYGHSDVYPFEVVNTVSMKTLEIRPMGYKLTEGWKPEFILGGFAGHCTNQQSQTYDYHQLPDEPVIRIRKHKNDKWFDKSGNRYVLSEKPRRFYDYNF